MEQLFTILNDLIYEKYIRILSDPSGPPYKANSFQDIFDVMNCMTIKELKILSFTLKSPKNKKVETKDIIIENLKNLIKSQRQINGFIIFM